MMSNTTSTRYSRVKNDQRRTNAYYLVLVCFCMALLVGVLVLFVSTLEPKTHNNTAADNRMPEHNVDPQTNPLVLPLPALCSGGRGGGESLISVYSDDDEPKEAPNEQTTTITNVDVWLGNGQVLYNQTVSFDSHTRTLTAIVAQVGQSQPGAIDGSGMIVTPGLVDVHSHAGVHAWPLDAEATRDTNERTDPLTPQVRAIDSFNPQDPAIAEIVRQGGVTCAQILPGSSNVIGGQAFLAKLVIANNHGVRSMLPRFSDSGARAQPLALKMACGENPKRTYGLRRDRKPLTRMGSAWLLREQLQRVREYVQSQREWCAVATRHSRQYYDPHANGHMPLDLRIEPLAELFRNRTDVLLNIHCYTLGDLQTMMRVAREFNITINAFHHALEAYKIGEQLRAANIDVATFASHWGYKLEAYDGSVHSTSLLHAANVRTVMKTDHPVLFGGSLLAEASKAQHYGLDQQTAFASVTSEAAALLHVQKYVGTLEVGKHADLVLWSSAFSNSPLRSPLDISQARVERVWIDGRLQYALPSSSTPATGVNPFDQALQSNDADTVRQFVQDSVSEHFYLPAQSGEQPSRNDYFAALRYHAAQNASTDKNQLFSVRRTRFINDAEEKANDNEWNTCSPNEHNALRGEAVPFVIRSVDILTLDKEFYDLGRESTQTHGEDCLLVIEGADVACIQCVSGIDGQCSLPANRVEFSFSANVDVLQSTPSVRPVATLAFVSGASGEHLGLREVHAERSTHDSSGRASGGTALQRGTLRTHAGIQFRTRQLSAAYAAGISIALTVPDATDKLVAGPSVAFSTHARTLNTGLVCSPCTLHMSVGNAAKRSSGVRDSDSDALAESTSGQLTLIEQLLEEAATSYDALENKQDVFSMTPWQQIIGGHVALSIGVHQADQMVSLANLKARYGIDMVFVGASEVHLIADIVQSAGIGVVLSPLQCQANEWERRQCNWTENVRQLLEKRVEFAISTDEGEDVRDLRWHASQLLAHGVGYEQALQTISTQVVRLLRLPEDYESVRTTRRANLLVYDNDPLSLYSSLLLSVQGNNVGCSPKQR